MALIAAASSYDVIGTNRCKLHAHHSAGLQPLPLASLLAWYVASHQYK
jgi:hypothetical protein